MYLSLLEDWATRDDTAVVGAAHHSTQGIMSRPERYDFSKVTSTLTTSLRGSLKSLLCIETSKCRNVKYRNNGISKYQLTPFPSGHRMTEGEGSGRLKTVHPRPLRRAPPSPLHPPTTNLICIFTSAKRFRRRLLRFVPLASESNMTR